MDEAVAVTTTVARKRLTLVACILGSIIAFVDMTVVNVALPAIQRDLGGGLTAQQWIVDAYLLTLGSLILVGGSLGDIFGERRVFAFGVGAFGAASALCAAAPNAPLLIAARGVQGIAGALLTPSALAVIVTTFEGEERSAAIGTWTAWSGIAMVIGPLAGGELLALPKATQVSTFHCVTGWTVKNVHWGGVRIADVFDRVKPTPEAGGLAFVSAEYPYVDFLTMKQALLHDVMLAYEMNGKPLPREHGAPLRLIIPEMYGYKNVKWLEAINLVSKPEDGYWEQLGYDRDAWVGRSNGYSS